AAGPTRRSSGLTATRPVGLEELTAWFVEALVGVRTEEVALGLQQVCRQTCSAETIEVSQGRGDSRCGNAVGNRRCRYTAPASLGCIHGRAEVLVQQQVGQLRVLDEGFFNVAQER